MAKGWDGPEGEALCVCVLACFSRPRVPARYSSLQPLTPARPRGPWALSLHSPWKPLEDILEDVHTYGVLAWKTQIFKENINILYFLKGFTSSRPKRRRCAHLPACLPASSRKNAVGVHKNQSFQRRERWNVQKYPTWALRVSQARCGREFASRPSP